MKKLLLSIFTLVMGTSNFFGQCNVTLKAEKQKICSDENSTLTALPSDLKSIADFSDIKKVFDVQELKLDQTAISFITSGLAGGISYPFNETSGEFNMNIQEVQLKNTVISSGKLMITIETDLKQDLKVVFELPYFKINGKSLKDSIMVTANTNISGLVSFPKEFDLTNAIVDFSSGDPSKYNIVSYKVKPSIKITSKIFTGTEIGNLKIDLKNLTFTENISYKWFLNNNELTDKNTPNIEVNKTGTYKVITTSNCGSAEKSIDIQVLEKPTIKLNHKDTTIVIGNQLTIIATGAKAFLWSTKSDKDTITVKEAGIYSVTGTNEFGCTSSASIKLDLREKGVGLATINGLAFKVSPNPTSDLLHITMDEFKNKAITLADLNGKIVYTQTLTTENTTIVVDSFSKGVYLLNIIDGANTALKSQRIVIE
jgi:hypothetical protein